VILVQPANLACHQLGWFQKLGATGASHAVLKIWVGWFLRLIMLVGIPPCFSEITVSAMASKFSLGIPLQKYLELAVVLRKMGPHEEMLDQGQGRPFRIIFRIFNNQVKAPFLA
jgi:hypothetical protein